MIIRDQQTEGQKSHETVPLKQHSIEYLTLSIAIALKKLLLDELGWTKEHYSTVYRYTDTEPSRINLGFNIGDTQVNLGFKCLRTPPQYITFEI
jgi:hypothetical protein